MFDSMLSRKQGTSVFNNPAPRMTWVRPRLLGPALPPCTIWCRTMLRLRNKLFRVAETSRLIPLRTALFNPSIADPTRLLNLPSHSTAVLTSPSSCHLVQKDGCACRSSRIRMTSFLCACSMPLSCPRSRCARSSVKTLSLFPVFLSRIPFLALVSGLVRDPIEHESDVIVRRRLRQFDPRVHAFDATFVVVMEPFVGGTQG